jgi:uncharacterized protein YcfJ
MKTFLELLESNSDIKLFEQYLSEEEEISPEIETKIDLAVDVFLKQYDNVKDFNELITNEGFLGSIIGGLTGFALGKTLGKIVARVLGVEKGILYDMLTSRLVGAALGASIGKRM